MTGTSVKRSDKLAFMKIGSTFQRMVGFTVLSQKKNAKEYSRQYVDEDFENTDVTAYSPSIEFTFDQYTSNTVHTALVNLIDGEKLGIDAIVTILVVDKANVISSGRYYAISRDYAVIGDSEGDSTEAYTYKGTFKVKSSITIGTATISTDGSTATFTAGGVSI